MAQQQVSTNTFFVAKWVVSTDATQGTHTTIAAAITSASSGDTIFIRDGTYTENLTLKVGVNLAAFECDAFTPNVTIIGTCTLTTAGTVSISGIRLQTNSAALIAVTGSAASILNCINCYLNCTNNTGITYSSSSGSSAINIINCKGNIGTTGISLFTATGAGAVSPESSGIFIQNTLIDNTGASSTASTSSACNIYLLNSTLYTPLSLTSSGALILRHSNIECQNQNVTALTTAGTGVSAINFSLLTSGTASAISVGAGTSVSAYSSLINSTNANAVTGAGTFKYSSLNYEENTSTINPTTAVPYALTVPQGGTGLTATTINQLLYSSAANTIAGLATANSAILATNSSGVPSITTASGNWLNTSRTAFNVTPNGTISNVTGDGTQYTIIFGLSGFDQGSNFNTGTGTFTAPVTGKYQFNVNVLLLGVTLAMQIQSEFITTARTYNIVDQPGAITGNHSIAYSILASMTAGDTATVAVTVSGGTKTVSVYGVSVADSRTNFSGYLVC
jgi:hypothetical protein